MNLPFVTEPYFKCSCKYLISYFFCLLIFTGLIILVFVTVPDHMLNATVIRMAFIVSSFFISIVFSRIVCVCLIKKKEEDKEVLNVSLQETGDIVWYNN